MKFIRDIITEKKRENRSGEKQEPSRALTPDDELSGGLITDHSGLDEIETPLVENAESADPLGQSVTPDVTIGKMLGLGEKEPNALNDEEPAKSNIYSDYPSEDCFYLNDDCEDQRETGSRRKNMVDTLVKENGLAKDEAGLIPDEPKDLRFNNEGTVGGQMFGLQKILTPSASHSDQSEDENTTADTLVTSASHSVAALESTQTDGETVRESTSLRQDEVSESISKQIKEQPVADMPHEVSREAMPTSGAENTDQEPTAVVPAGPLDQENAAVKLDVPVSVPKPAAGRAMGRSGRVKTRLLGFSGPDASGSDLFAKRNEQAVPAFSNFPVGWLVVVDGPGRGAAFTLFSGVSQIGRGPDQTVRLNFGDNSISRENHAAIAYDAEQQKFYLGHGGKANLVRLNDRPVLCTEELESNHQIRVGETVMRFVALCGEQFCWGQHEQDDVKYASNS